MIKRLWDKQTIEQQSFMVALLGTVGLVLTWIGIGLLLAKYPVATLSLLGSIGVIVAIGYYIELGKD